MNSPKEPQKPQIDGEAFLRAIREAQQKQRTPQIDGSAFVEAIHTAQQERIIREARSALIRTIANTGIAIADFYPGVGGMISLIADIAKLPRRLPFVKHHPLVKKYDALLRTIDLTPDVSAKVSILTELLELPALGFAPTHAIEGGMQLVHDIPRMKAGWIAWQKRKDIQAKLKKS